MALAFPTRNLARLEALARLREQVAGVRNRCGGNANAPWELSANGILKGLPRGVVHEWIGTIDPLTDATEQKGHRQRKAWVPPLGILIHIAGRAHEKQAALHVIWIGEQTWPYPIALCAENRSEKLLDHSIFVRARNPAQRLWAIDLALRSGTAAAVIADGSGLDLAATRRLQLAAEAGGALCLLARPPWEQDHLSAAATRWLVRWGLSLSSKSKRWTVELLRCKGVQPASGASRFWNLEQDSATRVVVMVPDMVDRSGAAQDSARERRTA